MMLFGRKIGILGFVEVGLLGVMMAIYISWCHSHIIMTLYFNLNKKQFIEARTVFSRHLCVVGMHRVKRENDLLPYFVQGL